MRCWNPLNAHLGVPRLGGKVRRNRAVALAELLDDKVKRRSKGARGKWSTLCREGEWDTRTETGRERGEEGIGDG